MAGRGLSPRELRRLTPLEAYVGLFEADRPARPKGDRDPRQARLDALHRWNHEAAARGEKPATPQWFAEHLPKRRT